GEHAGRVVGAPAHGLARGLELAPCALGEPVGADGAEHLVGGSKLLAGVRAAPLMTEPLAVSKAGPGELDRAAAPLESLDRLAVERVRVASLAQQGACAGLDAERPVRAAGSRPLAQAVERGSSVAGPSDMDACLDQLDEGPPVGDDVLVLACPLRSQERVGVV